MTIGVKKSKIASLLKLFYIKNRSAKSIRYFDFRKSRIKISQKSQFASKILSFQLYTLI